MKILQVIHDFLPRHQAGSELYCYHLSQGLMERGHDIRVFTSEIDHQRANYSLNEREFDDLIIYELINNHNFVSFQETYDNPKVDEAFERILQEWQPDVVHFHHLLNLSYGCVSIAKRLGVPIVFTLHDYWLTCPRGGGQRFRGEGMICHEVDTNLCAECISRYSISGGTGVRAIKRIMKYLEPVHDPTLITTLQKGKIQTPQSQFVRQGVCDINGNAKGVLYAHPPSSIQANVFVPKTSVLSFSIAMAPDTYYHQGDGVLFRVKCDDETIFEKFLDAKNNETDQGWHDVQLDLSVWGNKQRLLTFETHAYPNGKIDFCSACWGEPKMIQLEQQTYKPSKSKKVQRVGERILSAIQRRKLRGNVEQRTEDTRKLFQQVDLFIAPSEFLRHKFIEYGLPAEKIVFSDYGIAALNYTQTPRLPSKPIRFVYVGTLVEHKGLHVLIEAFNSLPNGDAILDVYGSLDEFTSYVSRIQAMIAHPGINLKGRAENEAIPTILANCDVLVIPSIWFENSPITIHEAFLAQVPVITSRFGGMAGLVKHGYNGLLFDVGDPISLYYTMKKIVDNPDYLTEIRPIPSEVKTIPQDCEWIEEQYLQLKNPSTTHAQVL